MKPFNTPLEKETHHIRLSEAERSVLRDRVRTFMEYHPAVQKDSAPEARLNPALFFAYIGRRTHARTRAGVGALMLFLVVTVPAFAEYTLPGDTLYPVKVRFNEEVLSTLSVTTHQKIAWETKRVERRIAEARLLASEGRLDDETEEALSETVEVHAGNVQREIEELRADDAEEAEIAQITFESALDVQSAVLKQDNEDSVATAEDDAVDRIAQTVEETRVNVVRGSASTTNTVSFERLHEQIQAEQERIETSLGLVTEVITDEDREEIEKKSANLEAEVVRAGAVREESEDEARKILRKALSQLKKLALFIDSLEVRDAVTLDTLIPEADVEGVQKDAIDAELKRVTEALEVVRAREDFDTKPSLREDVAAIESLLADAGFMLLEDEVESAKILSATISERLSELQKALTEADEASVVDEEGGSESEVGEEEGVEERTEEGDESDV